MEQETGGDRVYTGTRPGAGRDRLVTLDFIRGVAVLGILYANIVGYSEPMLAAAWPGALSVPMDTGDRIAWAVQLMAIDGKMRGLFALLFGASLALFTDAKGGELQVRRLVWLGVFGLAHYFLLFRGDILFSYAVCGLLVVAIGAHRLGASAALAVGIVLYLLGAAFSVVPYLADLPGEKVALLSCPDMAQCLSAAEPESYWSQVSSALTRAEDEANVMRGSWLGIVAYNLTHHGSGPFWGAYFALFESFPAMLLGIGFYRAGIFAKQDRQAGAKPRRLLLWSIVGIVTGSALSWPFIAWLMRTNDPLYLTFFVLLGPAQVARLPVILGLAGVLAWLAPRVADGWLGRRFTAAGRMAFSNYIGTSLIMAIVFQGWGFGLFGTFGRLDMMVPVLLGWAVMLAWSYPWLKRFEYGPLEWCWRCLTYGRWFSVRRVT
ncbi:hypothetical protein MB02_01015 [Croceicoccus estronivorus]|uniref:DUF418 domain-containing protein n=1 Tax=Croceicoccus estronivorus TaxID=1172626 RepID=UPI0008352677|nr:DUF418 domain-containing protein [Croceicoccus estronivorus]OCC25286.1 hypothetical protein MB02_01015 [Croceicoccus estronivorus]